MFRLPHTTQLLYAELLQQCAIALPNQRGISFVTKTVVGKQYWYMELVVGSTKRQYSLGRDTDELRAQIEKQKRLFYQAAPDLKQREKLVAMLVSGGGFAPGVSDGRVLEVLAQAGTFLTGGVLVGSHAFNTYGNMLGVSWASAAMQTQDMDLASVHQVEIAMRRDAPNVKTVLLESGMGFFEAPALNPKSPSTSFKQCCASIPAKQHGRRILTKSMDAWKSACRRGSIVKTEQQQGKALQKALNANDQSQFPKLVST